MNNIESLKNVLTDIKNQMESETNDLNSALSAVGMKKVNLDDAIMRVGKQIESAETKFTIAFVGTFKMGKSTILNSLLNLKGDARLSNEYDPDTAKGVRIIKRNGRDYEAEVDFGGKYPTERISWKDAKKYTSHVALDAASDDFRERAEAIEEVRYYVDSPLLDLCNIFDLPGTGTGSNPDDDELTKQKIMESDCFFWVLTTESEPDLTALSNLDLISSVGKMLPIINVWQYEKESISSEFTPEQIMQFLEDRCPDYLQNAEDPVFYYAKEIDEAQQEGRELKPEWGKEAFVKKVEKILSNIRSGDKANRIRSNMITSFTDCVAAIESVRSSNKLKELLTESSRDKSQVSMQRAQLDRCRQLVSSDLSDQAKKTAGEIINIFSDASKNFIDQKMSGNNLNQILRMFTKKQKEKMAEDFGKEFREYYLKTNTTWLKDCVAGFTDDVIALLKGRYNEFSAAFNDVDGVDRSFDIMADFDGIMNSIAAQIQNDLQGKLINLLTTTVMTALLFLIPGYALLDSISVIVSSIAGLGQIGSGKKLQAKAEMIKNQSDVQIRQQKYTIIRQLNEQTKEISEKVYNNARELLNKLDKTNSQMREKLGDVESCADKFEQAIKLAETELAAAIGG